MKTLTRQEAEHSIESMSEAKFEEFLSLLPEEITEEDKQIMRTRRAWIKFFTDLAYNRAVTEAFKEVVAPQIWAEANAK